MSTTTPLMRQFLEIKADYQDAILFFRLGDFYEMFMEDAVLASRVLGITLTSRNKGDENAIPLCGIPFHSSQGYIAKLISAGHKVAICEQVEDPKEAKGIVKREVVKVVTPGLVTDTDTLDPKVNNYLLAVVAGDSSFGVAHVDITTGEFRVTEVAGLTEVESELGSLCPREVLFVDNAQGADCFDQLKIALDDVMCNYVPEWVCESDEANEQLRTFFGVTGLQSFGCQDLPSAQAAAAAVLYYLQLTQKEELRHIRSLQTYHTQNYMVLDETTRRNLELTATLQDGKKHGSLLGVLDRTVTAMGGRHLRHWIHYPLVDLEKIKYRQEAIAELVDESLARMDLVEALDGVYDLERLNSKIAMASANAKDLAALRASLEKLPRIDDLLASFQSHYLRELRERVDLLPEVVSLLSEAIVDEPPFVIRDGGLIRDGFNEELDELKTISREGKGWIAALEQQERERTGIPSLKVKYNKVFGYFIEVTHRNLDKVPEDYQRKQTLTNAERFITPGLKDYEAKVLNADERMVELEYNLFQQVRIKVAAEGARIQGCADALAALDALISLADLAHERNYVRPQLDDSGVLAIEGGRHPVVERMPLKEAFVPNDVELDNDSNQLLIITGPNMAGKSTFMRQVALISLMAQLGSFVPADAARMGVVDRIFTRVGASDNLAKGESTFMVEMNETANILRHATNKSLVILDEIGRGTSTFDGVSIAWAVAEYLHDNNQVAAKTLFATHYHELTDLALTRKRIKNYNVAVKEWNDQIIFLRKIVAGGASRSYGIQVGRLAGLPDEVIGRAKEILKNLESGEYISSGKPRLGEGKNKKQGPVESQPQMSLFNNDPAQELKQRIEGVDLSNMTPLDALNFLDELKKVNKPMKLSRAFYRVFFICLILLICAGQSLAEPYAHLRADYQELSRSVQLQRQRTNWEKLLNRFDAYVRKNPLSSSLDKALFLQARTWDGLSKASGRKDDAQEALSRYVAMSERFPNSRLADDALFHAGQAAEYRIRDKHRARALYEMILERFPTGDMVTDARKRLAVLPSKPVVRSQPKVLKQPVKVEEDYHQIGDAPRLENVRFWSGPEYTRIVLDLSAPVVAKPHKLNGENPRVYFDLLYTRLGNDLPSIVGIQNGLVRQVRSSLFDEQRTRVVIDLNRVVDYRLITLENPHRLVIDVLGAPEKEVLTASGTASQGRGGDDSIASILDSSADRLPSLHVPQTRGDEGIKLVVVDAGHGGRDPGAIGPSGVYEKNVTLPLAKALAKALRQKMGVKVLMTRTDDRYLELRERTDYANRVGADLFISLHANASPRGKAYGVETYFLNLSKNNQAAEVAARENGTSLQEVGNLEAILFDLMANAKINESSRLAAEVQQSMVAGLKPHFNRIKDLGVKQGPFHVLLGATMPSVLIEAAFISHPREEKRLTSSTYQKHVANAIVTGVMHYSSSLEQVAQR